MGISQLAWFFTGALSTVTLIFYMFMLQKAWVGTTCQLGIVGRSCSRLSLFQDLFMWYNDHLGNLVAFATHAKNE